MKRKIGFAAVAVLAIMAALVVASSNRAQRYLGLKDPGFAREAAESTRGGETGASTDGNGIQRIGRLVVVGDSYSVSPAFREALEKGLPGVRLVFVTKGGSSLSDQNDMLAERKRLKGWPFLIMDGGLTDRYPFDEIRYMIETQAPECGFWMYAEPAKRALGNKRAQDRRLRQTEKVVSQFQAEYPEHLIEWVGLISQASDGSAGDRIDLQAGILPRSVRKDNVHLTDEAYARLGSHLAQRLRQSSLAANCDA